MKIITLLLISGFLITELYSQENKLRFETGELIYSLLLIRELNPTEQQKTDSVNKLFKFSLNQYLENGTPIETNIDKAFKLLMENGSSEYGDSYEERNMKSRRALCFASMALLSKEENMLTFIYYSKFSILGKIENSKINLLEERLLGLLWLETLIKHDKKELTKIDVQKIQDFILLYKSSLSSSIISKSNNLIKDYLSCLG